MSEDRFAKSFGVMSPSGWCLLSGDPSDVAIVRGTLAECEVFAQNVFGGARYEVREHSTDCKRTGSQCCRGKPDGQVVKFPAITPRALSADEVRKVLDSIEAVAHATQAWAENNTDTQYPGMYRASLIVEGQSQGLAIARATLATMLEGKWKD